MTSHVAIGESTLAWRRGSAIRTSDAGALDAEQRRVFMVKSYWFGFLGRQLTRLLV